MTSLAVWCLWHGGASYAAPKPEDVERFDSIQDAIEEFSERASSARRDFPCVNAVPPDLGGPSMHVYYSDPDVFMDPYPDRVIEFNSRGVARVMRA